MDFPRILYKSPLLIESGKEQTSVIKSFQPKYGYEQLDKNRGSLGKWKMQNDNKGNDQTNKQRHF